MLFVTGVCICPLVQLFFSLSYYLPYPKQNTKHFLHLILLLNIILHLSLMYIPPAFILTFITKYIKSLCHKSLQ
jgi:hypothetical protein